MHYSAQEMARSFFDTYSSHFDKNYTVVEIGSSGASEIKNIFNCPNYKGMDLEEGTNVDVVLTDPYSYPFEDNSVDVVVSSSCFEHVPMFWLSFLEGMRILKPNGLFYINAPSSGDVHKYPVDCWRFYPDSGDSLVLWAKRNRYNPVLLDSFICSMDQTWKDCINVFLKDEQHLNQYPKRMSG